MIKCWRVAERPCSLRKHKLTRRQLSVIDQLFGLFFFSSRRRHTRYWRDWSSDVCSSDLFNERTNSPFNFLQYPTDIVLLVVLWRVRYKLSLRDLAEMFLERGFEFTHEAVREWEARFAPLLADQLRAKRRRLTSRSWHVDETYIKVGREWKYLYRAIDRDGNLIDVMLSETR